MKSNIFEDDDNEYVKVWFDHIYAWNRVLDSAGYIDYKYMDTETKRLRTYAALRVLACDSWATAADVEAIADIGDGDMECVLLGLSYMNEVVVELLDTGDLGFQLTKFGDTWASALLAEYEIGQ